MTVPFTVAGACLVLTAGIAQGQTSESSDGWLMQNYRFTGPPASGEVKPTDPVISELEEIQNTTLAILRKANFAGDFEAALAAAAQATANAQLRGSIAQRLQSPQPGKTALEKSQPEPPIFLIALKDGNIVAARSYWTDEAMLYYITPAGAHEQVRLNLVDGRLSGPADRHRKPPLPRASKESAARSASIVQSR